LARTWQIGCTRGDGDAYKARVVDRHSAAGHAARWLRCSVDSCADVIDVDGSDPREVIARNRAMSAPDWSPDGARIAFASERDGNWEIYTMNADGSQPQRLTVNEAQDLDPTWRP
jgi:Tol biopolymer transport system component